MHAREKKEPGEIKRRGIETFEYCCCEKSTSGAKDTEQTHVKGNKQMEKEISKSNK